MRKILELKTEIEALKKSLQTIDEDIVVRKE